MSSDHIARLRRELVEAAAREQPGRRRVLALGRFRLRPAAWRVPRLRVIAFAAVAVVAMAVALSALRTGTDEAPVEQPSPVRLEGRPLFGGSLEPGVRYATRALDPQLSFLVAGDRWFVRDATRRDILALERRHGRPGSEGAARSFLVFGTPTVTDPATGRELPAPRDLFGWLRDHPDLRSGRSGRATVAGMPATYLDTTASFTTPAQREPRCEELFLPQFDDPTKVKGICTKLSRDFAVANGHRTRWLVVETGGRPLVITIEGWTQRDYERVVAPAQRVLESLRVGR